MASFTTGLIRCFPTSDVRRMRRQSSRDGYFVKAGIVCLMIAGAAGYYFFGMTKTGTVIDEEMFHQAEMGDFVHDVVEKGEVESARNVEVQSLVRGSREVKSFEIIWVIDEGKMVKEGDVLVRLDSSALEEEAKLQQLDLSGAVAGLAKAENELDAANIAMTEYVDGLFVQEKREIEAEIVLAEETKRRAEEYYAYSSRLAAKGFVTSLQLEGDKFAVRKAQIELDNARHKLEVLVKQTKEKKIKELESAIGVAKADLESAKERHGIEQKRLDFFVEQIKNCTIIAPASGQVVYANERGNREASEFIVEPGTTVRERQTIIRLPDYTAMQVHVLINESRVALVDPGMKTTITLDAFEGLSFTGTVTKVNEYPEPISRFGAQVKRYAAIISIDGVPRQIKPGLTANVAIHVEQEDNVLMVPVQSVIPHGDDYYCMVRNGDEVQPRQVQVGSSNSRFVVVNDGVKPNDFVSLSPRRYLDSVEMPELKPEGDKDMGQERVGKPDRRPGKSPGGAKPQKSPGEQDRREQDSQLADRDQKTYDTKKVVEEEPVRIAEDQPPQAVGGAQ